MADRPAGREVDCRNEFVHGEHGWLFLGAFPVRCPGYVGAVPVVLEPPARGRRLVGGRDG